jgi:XTP/dITP diphosphohydrolase
MNLVLATKNPGKLKEMQALAEQSNELNWLTFSLAPSNFSPDETGSTFASNALIKAQAAAQMTNNYALSDDSGICVDALEGRPGVLSARYADSELKACNKLLAELKDTPPQKRTAAYHCVMALVSPDGQLLCQADGIWQGRITTDMRGTGGFGYDPIFFLDSHNKTVAEISLSEKNKLSHRAQAWQKIKQYLTDNYQKN